MSNSSPMRIEQPLVLMFRAPDGTVITHLYPGDLKVSHYGILVADLVRNIAAHFKVDDSAVWSWVDRERDNPTSPVIRLS